MQRIWIQYKEVILLAGLVLLLVTAAAAFVAWHQADQIGAQVEKKIDRVFPPVTIPPKYDSATASRFLEIEVSRRMDHRRIDSLHDRDLQSALDSAFNFPR